MQVIFSNHAYGAVVSEATGKIGVETGGVFLGRFYSGIWYVIETIGAGPKAIYREAYFEYDQQYVEDRINEAARKYKANLTLIGNWHTHSGLNNTFSQMDNQTNSAYAELTADGAISALVNIDSAFRMKVYHVAWPLKYTEVGYKTGDEFIPRYLCQAKKRAKESLAR